KCPKNQQYDKCGPSCPKTCENLNDEDDVCDQSCKIGCRCKDGFVLNGQQCILPEECPKQKDSEDEQLQTECPKDQVYDDCGSKCPKTCENVDKEDEVCGQSCKIGCRCNDGFVLNGKDCIDPKKCPRTKISQAKERAGSSVIKGNETKCDKNEKYTTCRPSCQTTCAEYKNGIVPECTKECFIGCVCEDGFYRNAQNVCTAASECPK
ncbi:scavenger receptor cysteine-rich protein-like protein, partial [Leptotrombidium deliense]